LLWGAGYDEQALQLPKQLEVAEPDLAYFETGDYPNYVVELKKDALLTQDAAQSSVAEAAAKGFTRAANTACSQHNFRSRRSCTNRGSCHPIMGRRPRLDSATGAKRSGNT
jgi:hypothetical protein